MNSIVKSLYFAILYLWFTYGHNTNDIHTHPHSHSHSNDDNDEMTFESVNEKVFQKRIVGYNYTKETIGGKHIKYYITDTGHWHIDACSVIGKEGIGLMGTYRRLAEKENPELRRRLNPYQANNDGTGEWPNGIVRYEDAHGNLNIQVFQNAINQYMQDSPIRLIEITPAEKATEHWIRIFYGSGCWSMIGRVNRAWQNNYNGQDLSLGDRCDDSLSTVMHEFGHALGMYHTQSRSDRDQYIRVLTSNIQQGGLSQYEIANKPVCGEYDCGSMMHYFNGAFSSCGNCPTMEVLDASRCVIGRNGNRPLSIGDKFCLCQLYPPGTNGQPSSSCGGTDSPTKKPTLRPSLNPSVKPSSNPTTSPNPRITIPTTTPTKSPSKTPTITPSAAPTISPVPTVAANGFCLTGRAKTGRNTLLVVGYYVEQPFPDGNGNTYYKNQRVSCQNEDVFAYYIAGAWRRVGGQWVNGPAWYIHTTLLSTTYFAACYQSDIYQCSGEWYFSSGLDPNVEIVVGSCFTSECTTLTLATNNLVASTACDGSYTKTAINTFTGDDNGHILEYNDYYELWRCYPTGWANQISSCNSYTGLPGSSEEGVLPTVTDTQATQYRWSGQPGATAFLQCGTVSPPTSPPVPNNVRPMVACASETQGTLTAGQTLTYNFIAPADGTYAMAFHSCDSTTDVQIVISETNLIGSIRTDDYAQYWCNSNPERGTQIFWRDDYATSFMWIDGGEYSVSLTSTAGGTFKLNLWCYASAADALNFGRNQDGEYVPIFSFKAYGPVQWGIFFGVLIAIIIVNVVGCFIIIKCILKKKSVDFEAKLNDSANNNQPNIQLAADDDDGAYTTR